MTPRKATGSSIVAALEATWAAIQSRVPDLPDVVFITGTGLMGRGAKWGHYRRQGWALRGGDREHEDRDAGVRFLAGGRKPEVFIAGERLATGAENTLQTILHEAAHALAAVRGHSDTSKEGRYHNRTFLVLAEELGLAFEGTPDATIGYSAVLLTPASREVYADAIGALDAAIVAYLDTFEGLVSGRSRAGNGDGENGPTVAPTRPKSRNNPRALCGCESPRIIRASRAVLAVGPIVCGVCGEEFRAESEES